jgi:hypothetical protein
MLFPMTASLLGIHAAAAGVGHLFGNAMQGLIYFDGWLIGSMLAGILIGKAAYMMSDECPIPEAVMKNRSVFDTAGGSYTSLV